MDKVLFNYSIIIPHHNLPVLLERCLQSIPRRDDLQIIVVDDNSDESCKRQLKGIEVSFPYVELVYMDQNGGGGKARNIGLEHAKGDYVLFADADDYFNPCLNSILNDYIEETADMVFFAANSVDTDTYQKSDRGDYYSNVVNSFNGKDDFNLRYCFGVPWSRLVRREFLASNNIRFQETIRHNDVGFATFAGYYAKTIKTDNRAIYCVTTRKNSVSTNVSLDAMKAGIYVYVNKYFFLKSKGISSPYPDYVSNAMMRFRKDKESFKECVRYAKEMGLSSKEIKIHYYPYLIESCLRWIKNKAFRLKMI